MVGCSVYGLWEETVLTDVIKPLSTEGTTLWPYILLVFSQCLSCRKTDACVCKPGVSNCEGIRILHCSDSLFIRV